MYKPDLLILKTNSYGYTQLWITDRRYAFASLRCIHFYFIFLTQQFYGMQKFVFPISPHVKMQWTARVLMALALLLFCFAFVTPNKASSADDGWVLQQTVSNVDFYYMLANCDGKNVVLLKFNNKNNHKVKIAWKEVFTTQFEKGVEGINGQKQLIIDVGETFSAGCHDKKIQELIILPAQVKPTYLAQVQALAFKNISVTAAY